MTLETVDGERRAAAKNAPNTSQPVLKWVSALRLKRWENIRETSARGLAERPTCLEKSRLKFKILREFACLIPAKE